MKKKFYKSWLFWIFIAGGIVLLGNILALLFVPSNIKGAWLTLISGWVSGFATLLVGIIAYIQNREFSKIEKTNTLLNQIVNYTSEYEIGYINYFKIERIDDLIYDIRDCSLQPNSRAKDNRVMDIEDEIIFLLRDQDRFEALLQKSFFGSDNIILLHKQVIKLGKKLNSLDVDEVYKNYGEDYFYNECRKSIKFIRRWMNETDYIAHQVLLDYQDLRSEILNGEDISKINEKIVEEEKIISEYFKEYTRKEQDNG